MREGSTSGISGRIGNAVRSGWRGRVLAGLGGLGMLLLGAGCGPVLLVKTQKPARIYVRPSHDASGNALPKGALIDLGESPAEWDVPEALYGGKAYVKAVFPNGEREVFGVVLPISEDDDDRATTIQAPKGLK